MATPAATLLKAAKAGDVARVVRCLEQPHGAARVDVNCLDGDGSSPLILVAMEGHVDVTEVLVGAGANINHVDNKGNTALVYASYWHHARVVKVLLAAGAEANYANPNGDTALTLAAEQGHVNVMKVLVSAGANINHANNKGDTALTQASAKCHVHVVEALVGAGAAIDHVNNDGDTALTLASWFNHASVVKLLLAAGANVNYVRPDGDTALISASWRNHVTIARMLLEAGALLTIQSKDGTTALKIAEQNSHEEIIDMLRHFDGSASAAFAAIARNDFAAFSRLVDKHKNARGCDDRTLLHVAAGRGRLDMVQVLVDRGVNVDIRDANDWAAIHHAAKEGHVEIVKLLLARGGRSSVTNTEGRPPVMIAAAHGHVDIVRELHTHGARLTCIDNEGRTLLHHAAGYSKSATVVEYLLADCKTATDDINSRDQTVSTPLHDAGRAGNADAVAMMISHGADINARNRDGETALVIASARGHEIVVTTLLTHGARTDLATTAVQTALSVALSAEIRSVLQLYCNSQQFHKRCAASLSAVDSNPTESELMELVPLITSAYDLRLFVSLVTLTCCGDSEREKTTRATVLNAALTRVATSKLVYDDHACVFFKLMLKHCKSNAWLSPRDLLWLDRQAEKVNNENADWVFDLQKKVHNHSWRLDAHEQSLRRVVDGVKHIHAMVLDNRQAIKAVRSRIGHVQSQVDTGKKLMQQLITHGNQLSDHLSKLQKRLVQSEANLIAVAEGLQAFHGGYVARLGQEEKTKKIKMIGGLVASIAGFAFAPVLKEAFDAVVDLTNPIEVFGLAYYETDIVTFLAESTTEHALVPLVESQLEKLMIPKDEFETLLREEIALQHPELLDECAKRGLLTLDVDELVVSGKAEYVRTLEPSLLSEASVVDALLGELQFAVSKTTIHPTLRNESPSKHGLKPISVSTSPVIPPVDNQYLEKRRADRSETEIEELQQMEKSAPTESSFEDVDSTTASSTVVFVDDADTFPYHAAVRESHGQLNEFHELIEVLVDANDDVSTVMAMRVVSSSSSRETLCAAEYAYCLGHREVGDFLAAHRMNTEKVFADRATSTAPVKSVELMEADDEFVYICIVNACGGDTDACEEMCEAVEGDGHAIDARIQAQVVRESSVDVSWTAVKLAAHLGYVEVVKHLLKSQSLPGKMKIQLLKQAKDRAKEIEVQSIVDK